MSSTQTPGLDIRNEQIDPGGLSWKTFPERLHEAGISWKHYPNELSRAGLSGAEDAWLANFGDNVLECFNAYNVEAYPGYPLACRKEIDELSAHAATLESSIAAASDAEEKTKLQAHLEETRRRLETVKAALADSGEERYRKLSTKQAALHNAAFVTNAGDTEFHALHPLTFEDEGKPQTMHVPKGDVFYQFRKDVKEGNLPAISWLSAPEIFPTIRLRPGMEPGMSRK